ncbi:hypothetical protein GCM10009863_44950 [Streptomyces axinellae]|uniref:Uncharacterized protein n=1 Tax=Streptomyces axinellae TaxID=552788 RepID=A0ABN3QFP6_9ACTN
MAAYGDIPPGSLCFFAAPLPLFVGGDEGRVALGMLSPGLVLSLSVIAVVSVGARRLAVRGAGGGRGHVAG